MLTPITDEQLLKAIARLNFQEDFVLLVQYWEGELARLRADNDVAVGLQLGWQQGAAQALSDQLTECMTVREKLTKISAHPVKRRSA